MVYVKHVDIHILAQSFIKKKKTVNKKLNVVIFLLLKKIEHVYYKKIKN